MGMGPDSFDIGQAITRWTTPGPQASAFVESAADAAFICGPVGSGKSTAADVVKPLLKAQLQIPGADGVRHYRLITFRDTQRNAWKSTIPTVRKWINFDVGEFTGSEDRPCRLKFTARHMHDGGKIVCEFWWFGMPTSREDLEAALKGVEATDMNLAEADQLPRYAFEWCGGRIGRHPSGSMGRAVLPQIWGSFNATDFDAWLYDICVTNPLAGVEFFHQAPALLTDRAPFIVNPNAENLHNLPEGYYERQARQSRPGYISRALMARFGPVDGEGFLVYPEFVNTDHVAPIEPIDGDLFLGIDGGSTPAATLKQRDQSGRVLTLAECVIYDTNDEKRMTLRAGVGPTQFAENVQMMVQSFEGLRLKKGWIDPSAFYGGDAEHGDLAFADRLARVLDVPILPAPTPANDRVLREEATRLLLTKRGDGGRPAILYSPRCRWTLMGLRGQFQYQTTSKNGVLVPSDKRAVVKNKWSHVCEADEYGNAGLMNGAAVLRQMPFGGQKHGFGKAAPKTTYKAGGVRW